MAITVDQLQIGVPVSSGVGGATIAITTNVVIAANTLIILVYGGDGSAGTTGDVSSVAGGSLTWTVDKQGQSTVNDRAAIISAPCVAGLASGTTLTLTVNSSVASRILGGMSILGADLTGTRVDGTPPAVATAATQAWACGSYTIANGSILVAAGTEDTSSSSTPASGCTEFLDQNEAVSGNTTSGVYRVEAAGGAFTAGGGTPGWASAAAWAAVGVAYKAAAGAVATVFPHSFTAIPFQAQGRNL